ncbi:CASP-like protein 2B1 [Cucumis melo var. makuwa]|uniref:CASP-like protein n=1 Tax=Cucumis melo var. makuwa TaxID=1194695 RepID=A0A5D3E6D4_CUCMM|nr:CASP-like protein 2B1 [Cucumis melo var. makuwa]TYK30865.1 CASP-like protein 2B1 [Cucumis melo var. makuwa]
MSYAGIGISPGNVPVYHGSNLKVFDKRVRVVELVLRFVICGLGVLAAVLVGTDTEVFSGSKCCSSGLLFGARITMCGVHAEGKSALQQAFSLDHFLWRSVAAVASAAQSAVFGKLGQPELQWMKICDLYKKFCNQVGEGLASAVVVSLSMVVLSCISASSLFRLYNGGKNKSNSRW